MKRSAKWIGAMAIGVGLCVAATSAAWASDTAIYDWPDDEYPVVIENSSGVFMIHGEEGKPTRAFSWRENSGDHDKGRRFVDMTGDGLPEIVGSGTPTFITDSKGLPRASFEDGCRQVWVANIVGRTDLDLVCVKRQGIEVYTGEGRPGPSVSLGRNIDFCRVGDITNDTTNDVECKYSGSNQFVRLEYNGDVFDVLNPSAEQARLEDVEETIDAWPAVQEAVWTGEQAFDLSGDGAAEETIHFSGGAVEIHSRVEKEALARIEVQGTPEAAIVKDLNGDGSMQIVAVTDQRIYVIGEAGEDVAHFSANASRYTRQPRAKYRSINVNGFEDNEAVRELVKGVKDDIGQCYGSRLRSAPFAGTGRHVVRVMVGEDGSVDQVQQRHSDVRDSTIESCANNALERINYPAPEASGLVNANIIFTFVDEEG